MIDQTGQLLPGFILTHFSISVKFLSIKFPHYFIVSALLYCKLFYGLSSLPDNSTGLSFIYYFMLLIFMLLILL